MEMLDHVEEEVLEPLEQLEVPQPTSYLTRLTPSALGQPAQRAFEKIVGTNMVRILKRIFDPPKRITERGGGKGLYHNPVVPVFQEIRVPAIPTSMIPALEKALVEATQPNMLEPELDAELDFDDFEDLDEDTEEESDPEDPDYVLEDEDLEDESESEEDDLEDESESEDLEDESESDDLIDESESEDLEGESEPEEDEGFRIQNQVVVYEDGEEVLEQE